MSSHSRLYIGPYIECKNVTINIPFTRRCCQDKDCSEYGIETNHKYCPMCGLRIASKTSSKSEPKVASMDVSELTNEAFHMVYIEKDNGKDILVPNLNMKAIKREMRFYPEQEDFIEDFYDVNKNTEVEIMLTQFSKEIKKIIELYTEQNVRFTWGIINEIV